MIRINDDFYRKFSLYILVLLPSVVILVFPGTQTTTMAFVPHYPLPTSSHYEHRYSSHKRTRAESLYLRSSATENESSTTAVLLPSFLSDNDGVPPPLHESEYTQVLSTTSLAPIATKLRSAYDDHFRDPRQPNGDRFAWDPWFVSAGDGKQTHKTETSDEDGNGDDSDDEKEITQQNNTVDGEEEALAEQIQYSLKRIQTSLFFPEDDYNVLVDDLVSLANSIGLTAISPPWTSMYTDGDTQNFHTDATHGPMAFVLSLSKEGDFRGGETMIMKQEILDLWRNFEPSKAMECGNIIRYV